MAKSKAKAAAAAGKARPAAPGKAKAVAVNVKAAAAKAKVAAGNAKAAGGAKPAARKPTRPTAAPRAKLERGLPAPAARASRRGAAADVRAADPSLFAPLTLGERADALRSLLEDERLRALAKVGRYRVISVEPLVVKPPEPLSGRRLARLVIYDYASDKCVDACVDLDRGAVCHVSTSTAQPMLSVDEEAEAVAIADADARVLAARAPGQVATATLHYWSLKVMDFAYQRRSAAVLYGEPGKRPSLVAVVSLIDREVVAVVPAEQW